MSDKDKLALCANLRWKSATRDSDDDAAILAVFQRNQVPYTCLETCQGWGPDGDVVAPECCEPGRSCFRKGRR
jgi:hypothetical protein